jgi:hypothetical protein
VELTPSTVVLTGWAVFHNKHQDAQLTLSEFIQETVHQDAKWAIERFSSIDDGAIISEAICQGKGVGVSDGSFKDSFGTACWIIQGDSDLGEIKCPCLVPGNGQVQSAYRSELAGLYGMITMINTLCAYHDIKDGAIELGCDGIQALQHVDQRCDITNPWMPQFDLLSATRNALRLCPIQMKMKHVKGHQDDDWEAVLDRKATLNVAADDGAKEHWYRTVNVGHQQHRIFAETWPITIGGTKICTRLDEAIREARHASKILNYWEEKGRFGNGNKVDIDWETVGSAMNTVTRSRRQWVTKHVSGFCSTGKMMRQWGKNISQMPEMRLRRRRTTCVEMQGQRNK